MTEQTVKTEEVKKEVKEIPKLKAGNIVRVYQKIKDVSPDGKEKERTQVFEGQVLGTRGGKGINATITVRKIASGVGVERIFPIHAPMIEKIEVVNQTRAKKAKLYYTRTGQLAKVK